MHTLAYLQTRRITAWKYMILKDCAAKMAYGCRDSRHFAKLSPGDTLWIISSNPGRPPCLTAKLVVENQGDLNDMSIASHPNARMLLEDSENRFPHVAIGSDDSCFFGYNDVGQTLLRLTFETLTGKRISFNDREYWKPEFAHVLQRPIRIGDDCVRYLESFAEHCAQNTVFISWKQMDHARSGFPGGVANALVKRALAVWLDCLALPPSKYSETILREHAVLSNLLRHGYRQSRFLLAIASKNFGTKTAGSDNNWTLDEWTGRIDSGFRKRRLVVHQNDATHPLLDQGADLVIHSHDPDEIAAKVSAFING